MRRSLIALFCLLTPLFSEAQTRHSISVNTNLYANFFNKEKEPFGPITLKIDGNSLPELSYKIERGNNGLELFVNYYYRKYNEIDQKTTQKGDFIDIIRLMGGLNYHRNVYQSRYLNVNPFVGITYGKYGAAILEGWYEHQHWTEVYIEGPEAEMYLGIQLGVNVNAPIWKGLHINGNLRYGAIPWARYDYFRHNMIVNVGLGYKF